MGKLDYKKIGMRIRQVRKAKEWSQDDLGHIERGSRIMSLETFTAVCDALETGADELLWGTVHPNSMLDVFEPSGEERKQPDSYSMYVRIMKSVAEIMNETQQADEVRGK